MQWTKPLCVEHSNTYNFEAAIAIVFALAQMELFVDDIIRCIVYDNEYWNRYNQINADDCVC